MKAKWVKGPRINDPLVVVSLIMARQPVFMGHKCQNASWAQGWQIGMIINSTKRGHMFHALPAEQRKLK